ncbi:DEAD/DEAH box helicase [Termitidicoccus mucosus]|uniref:Serine/threonine protein kinase n=1 Tax=Termitidicoccus mucosus TaxID=1184151 RepID=A0A178IC69_9BACT|nr:serine/threonine protein kinase [Opitutaceae bacterium TSB47]
MLRLFLPPNLATAAARDAIALKIELDASGVPPAALLPALALLQRWCGTDAPPPFIQITRAQLRELIATLAPQPVFFRLNQPSAPLLWVGPRLRGASEHLQESPPPFPAAPGASSPTTTPPASRAGAPARAAAPRSSSASTPMLVDGSEHYLAITLPSREHIAYADALELLKNSGFRLEPSNRKWWLRDRHKTLAFLAAHGAALRGAFQAEFTDNFEKNTARISDAAVVCDADGNDGGYRVTLGLRAGLVSEKQLLAAAASGRGYVEDDGGVYLLPPSTLDRLASAQRALAGEPGGAGGGLVARRTHRVNAARVADAESIIEEIAPGFKPPSAWRELSAALRDTSRLAPAPVPAALDALLRPYQRLGAAWLWHLRRHGLGGILADEMGLGKTLQALAVIAALKNETGMEFSIFDSRFSIGGAAALNEFSPNASQSKIENRKSKILPAPALVVCPASLVENWRREAARFAPALRVFIHHGNSRLARASDLGAHDLVITSYGTLARDRALFADAPLALLIADEAQHLKNRRSQNARALRSLRAGSRFLLTGTPLENSLDDLRSLLEILLPGYLDAMPAGTRGEERLWHDERLRARAAPYILRRTKESVAPELPGKIEQVIYCELTPAQAALYRRVHETTERQLLDLETGGASENAIRLATLTQLLRLRQVCCDPRLVECGMRNADCGMKTLAPDAGTGDDVAIGAAAPHSAFRNPHSAFGAADSAKLDTFLELLDEAIDDGHRILVFSQFTKLLDLAAAELDARGIAHVRLDGSMHVRARQAAVDRFDNDASVPVFLISLKAGGTGLNLTAADTVIHLDPWWNPAVEAQATDRAHRIGQTRVVTSYKLICSGTVEEKVLQLQDTKRKLLADVFEASDATAAKLTLADMKALLE